MPPISPTLARPLAPQMLTCTHFPSVPQPPPPLAPQARILERANSTAIYRPILKRLKLPKVPFKACSLVLAVRAWRPISRRLLQCLPEQRLNWQTWGDRRRWFRTDKCRLVLVCIVSCLGCLGSTRANSRRILHVGLFCHVVCFANTIFGVA